MIPFIFPKMQGNEMGYRELSTDFIAWRLWGRDKHSTSCVIGNIPAGDVFAVAARAQRGFCKMNHPGLILSPSGGQLQYGCWSR
jgi:hypothetical protein